MPLAIDTTYSFRAECQADVDRFFNACKEQNIAVDDAYTYLDPNGFPDREVEFSSDAGITTLKQLAQSMEDGHVVYETLRACPLVENSLLREPDSEVNTDKTGDN
jgi:hypothetical protein